MIKSLLLAIASVGLLSVQAQAQTAVAPSAQALAVRDSVFAQVAAIRTASGNNVSTFKSNFFAIRGLRTVTKSYTLLNNNIPVLTKKHVVKHKTTGALVEKVTYFNKGQKQMQEQYQNAQLANFTLLLGYEKGQPARTIRFVQGDYLSITRRPNPTVQPQQRQPTREVYHYPAAPVAR